MRRRRHDRPDSHELAAERLNAGVGPYEPLPAELKNYNGKRLMMLAALGIFVALLLGGRHGSSGPPVTGSCAKPGFSFDKTSIRYYGAVRWSVAGPDGSSVIITADSTSADSGRLAGPVPINECKASGRMGVPLKGGSHLLRVFLRSADGTDTLLGQKALQVNAPR